MRRESACACGLYIHRAIMSTLIKQDLVVSVGDSICSMSTCIFLIVNKHTHTHTRTCTHRQTGRARNEPGQKIRFLGGFAMGTGLQSTAAWGRRRSRGRQREGVGIVLSSQCRGWVGQMGSLGIPPLLLLSLSAIQQLW